MKITTAQLKQIIAEELKKAQLSEVMEPKDFYAMKADKLETIVLHIEKINDILAQIESAEAYQASGNLEEMQPLHDSLDQFEMDVTSLIDAVQALL